MSISEQDAIGARVTAYLDSLPQVANFTWDDGRAYITAESLTPHILYNVEKITGYMWVKTDPVSEEFVQATFMERLK